MTQYECDNTVQFKYSIKNQPNPEIIILIKNMVDEDPRMIEKHALYKIKDMLIEYVDKLTVEDLNLEIK